MKISEISNKIKVCDIIINNNNNDRRLWDIVWNTDCPSNILTQENGRCYFIVVDGDINKIGYSDCKGGIKSTIESYKSSGNSGRPSDRTHGIHILITEELLKGKTVEFYFVYNDLVECVLNLMDGSTLVVRQSLSGKSLEEENLKIYIKKESKHPMWNLQEAGLPWPKYLQESRNTLLAGAPATLESIKQRLGL